MSTWESLWHPQLHPLMHAQHEFSYKMGEENELGVRNEHMTYLFNYQPVARRQLVLMTYLFFPFPPLFPPLPRALPPRPVPWATLPSSPNISSPPVVLLPLAFVLSASGLLSSPVSLLLSCSSFFLRLLATSSALDWNRLRPLLDLGDLTGGGA